MNKNKKKIYLIIAFFSWLFLMYETSNIIYWFIDSKKTEQLSQKLQSTFKEETNSKALVNPPDNKDDIYYKYIDIPFLKVDFTTLLTQNLDTVAWLKVNGTAIDYPVVQTDNNEFYLTHSFDKTYNKAGWIFSDFRNNFKILNKNTIIYGHRRLDNSMFASLKNLLDDNWLNNDPIIKLSTPNANMIWQIFSIYTIPEESYYITTHFENDNQYQEFLNTIQKRSIYSLPTSIDSKDHILTLSSCKDNFGNRIVVHAKLIKKETS